MRLTPKAHETASKKRDLALRTGPRRERPRAAFCRARDVEKESRTPPTTASISCPFPPRRRSPRGPSAPSPAKARRRGPSPATSSSARPRPSASTATRRSRRAPRTRRPSGNARSFVRTLRCPSRGASQRSDAANMILNGFRPPRYVPAAPADVVDALLATAPAPARPVAAASPKQPAPSAEFRARVREPGGSAKRRLRDARSFRRTSRRRRSSFLGTSRRVCAGRRCGSSTRTSSARSTAS